MSGWKALNVDSDEEDQYDEDDSKELQLEEAFKLYQNALKLHSQGPAYFDQAREAYLELFQSEVFKYPEAISTFDEDHNDNISPSHYTQFGLDEGAVALTGTTDNANALPQLVYLAYKGRAQFAIDVAHAEATQSNSCSSEQRYQHYKVAASSSIKDSAAALEHDDTDLDLWKRAARVAHALASSRLARFCLESVLAGDDEDEDVAVLAGLDEAFAQDGLQTLLDSVQDDLSKLRSSGVQPRPLLQELLKISNDPYPFLLREPKQIAYVDDAKRPLSFTTGKIQLDLSSATHVAVARALLHGIRTYEAGLFDVSAGATVVFDIKESNQSETKNQLETVQNPEETISAKGPDALMVDADGSHDTSGLAVSETFRFALDHEIDTENKKVNHNQTSTAEQDNVDSVKDETLLVNAIDLPSRKRSSTVAGNEEPEARGRSKRIKARESMAGTATQDEELLPNPTSLYQEQHLNIRGADQTLSGVVHTFLESIGIVGAKEFSELRIPPQQSHRSQHSDLDNTIEDLQRAVLNWDEAKNSRLCSGKGIWERVETSSGKSLFMQHAKAASLSTSGTVASEDNSMVDDYLQLINAGCFDIHEALFLWLSLIFRAGPGGRSSMYMGSTWSPELKECVVKILKNAGGAIRSAFDRYSEAEMSHVQLEHHLEVAQSIFELHLDIYSEITGLAGVIDEDLSREQGFRLNQWAELVADTITVAEGRGIALPRALVLRYLWSSVTFVRLTEKIDKTHVLLCLHDLQTLLRDSRDIEVILPNNTVMPCISSAAAEQEIYRLKTLDFFLSVFEIDDNDSLAVIMKLEPILEYRIEAGHRELSDAQREQIEEFRSFLSTGDASLVLLLWRRLQNAYTAISYPTKVVSCLLRSVETIVREIESSRFTTSGSVERQNSLIQWLRAADDLITNAIRHITNDINNKQKVFYSLDDSHICESIKAVYSIMQILYGFVQTDDALRMGNVTPPVFRNLTASRQFEKARDRFREMYVQSWTMLYLLFKQAVLQILTNEHKRDRIVSGLLRIIHNSLGERQYCKYNNKLFVQLAKTELFSFDAEEDLSLDIAQVLFDLYGIRITAGYGDIDHGCQAGSLRDKQTAHLLVPILMDYAKRYSMKELLRGELKNTIDKIQTALGQNKNAKGLVSNRKIVSAYLKSPIKPQVLYNAMRGIGELVTKDVGGESAELAASGWYLLLGNMTLAKYKSIKRVNPTPTEDLDTAASYLRQDIEHKPTNWESWYRLAQIYDLKIEDDLIWGSTKLNDNRADIVLLEKNAINAYSMAIALSTRLEDYDLGTVANINSLCYDFAMRLYSSSRPPLDMAVFNSDKSVRHLSDRHSQVMSKQPMIIPMSSYAVWRLAVYLLRRSISQGGILWQRHYLLGKCLWKMSKAKENHRMRNPVPFSEAIESFQTAVEQVPSKERSADPVLEPHFKLVSAVHKLVAAGALPMQDAIKELEVTPYARGVRLANKEGVDDWDNAVLTILKKLQTADKSGWHHRITARAAQIKVSEDAATDDIAGALGAKQEFQNQIFHRNMTLQVWKPENERPGRHYVYTGRYLRFFVDVLVKLRDRTNLEQVVRRIRRKTTDFVNHERVWEDTVTSYIELLRKLHEVPRGHERAVFDNISFDEFNRFSEKLEAWAHDPTTTMSLLDALRDAVEMKKLNNSLMKSSVIDDMIGDTYAVIYEKYVSQLSLEERAPPQPAPILIPLQPASTASLQLDGQSDNRMAVNNLLSGQIDGSNSYVTTATAINGLGIAASNSHANSVSELDITKPERAKPGRAKTITRREVQKKAEAVIVKPPPIKTPTLTKRLIVDIPPSNKRQIREDGETDGDDGSIQGHLKTASQLGSRQNSPTADNTPEREVASNNDDDEAGADGDNEEDEDDEGDDASDDEEPRPLTRSLFPGLTARPSLEVAEKDGDGDEDDDGMDETGMTVESPLKGSIPNDVEIEDSQDVSSLHQANMGID